MLLLARAAGALPARVVLVGCQPERCEEYDQHLSPAVAAAVEVAVTHIHGLLTGVGVG